MFIVNQEDRRFFIFSRLWCLSTLFHLASFTYWFDSYPVAYVVTLGASLLHLLVTTRNRFFYSALCGSVVLVWLQIPHTPNHIFFEWFLNILFAFVLLYSKFFENYNLRTTSYFFNKTVAATRWSVVILYFFVVLHKLNDDFFDPYASCGAVLFEEIFERSGIFSIPLIRDSYYNHEVFFKWFSIIFTLAAEAIIPIMLMIRKWRNAGLVFGLFFHLLLSLHGHNGIFSFSAMLFTVFIFYWNDLTVNYFYESWNRYQGKIKLMITAFFILTCVIYFILPYNLYVLSTLLVWYLYAIIYLLIFLRAISGNYRDTFFSAGLRYKSRWPLLIPLMIVFNGMAPYLGLKTEASFSMFSNLRTEGNVTNHQFIPVSWQLFDYQKDLVTIVNTNYDRLKNLDLYHGQQDVKMVRFEFIKILNAAPDNATVEFEINDKQGIFEKTNGKIIRSDIDLDSNPILEKFLIFRIVHTDKSLCKH